MGTVSFKEDPEICTVFPTVVELLGVEAWKT
jgi:hypothetical protein